MLKQSCRAASLAALALALGISTSAAAAGCPAPESSPIQVGTVSPVSPGASRTFKVGLASGEGVIVDLVGLTPPTRQGSGDSEDEHGSAAEPSPRALSLCDSAGALLAPQPGEVFEKGGSVMATPDGERLRFLAPKSGDYIIAVAESDQPRELLVRRRNVGTAAAPVVTAQLDTVQHGITSSGAPMVFSFPGTGGQWVQLKSTSEKDTLLRLAGPDREGSYAVLTENDDSDGLNPAIIRKLPTSGTYYLQVDSLSEEPAEFELSLKRTEAPKPPPPPAVLRAGGSVSGSLSGSDDVRIYALPVTAGHSYRLALTAPYDGVVGIGLPNPVEPDDGGSKPDAGFADIKSQDANTSGTEKLTFTARSSGQLLVRVKSFGIGETDGGYILTVADLGG